LLHTFADSDCATNSDPNRDAGNTNPDADGDSGNADTNANDHAVRLERYLLEPGTNHY
jgi:hypothetical protein